MRFLLVSLAPRAWLRLPRRTARLRLTALYGGLFLASGIALLAATYLLFERATAFRTPQLPTIPHTPAIQPLKPPSLPQALFKLTQDQQKLTHDQRAFSVLPDNLGRPPSPRLAPQLADDQRRLTQDQQRLTHAVHQLAQAVHQVAQAGSAQAAQRASDSHQLLVTSGIALAVVAGLALVAGWLVAGRMLRPIRTIIRAARRISSTSLHERLALDGPEDELKELGDTLDALFARLEAAFEAQRHFIANASHELRTPLTRERALVQVALGDSSLEVWRSTGEELLTSNREQESLIDALIALASSERGLDQQQPIDLVKICETVLSRPAPDRLRSRITTDLRPATLDGDPQLIERLVANLLDNAIRHNITDGLVQISTQTRERHTILTVNNTGPVIPPSEIDRLFQPFQRLQPGRIHHKNGHGLGLSIVRAIATAHHAGITAQPLPEGGLSVTVAFPQSSNPSVTTDQPTTSAAAFSIR